MIVPLSHVLLLAGLLFLMGMFCAVTRRNLIMILIGLEIMLNAVSIAFVGGSLRWQQMEGQVFVLFILAVAGAEVSIGLALIVSAYKRTGSVDPDI
jgi:NADH-quinone oxidoreductase subunit K